MTVSFAEAAGVEGAIIDVFERPAKFLKEELGVSLWSKQSDILNALRDNRRVAVRSCNGSGKTFAAACAVIWWMMAFKDSAIVITTAPTERQVKELLWRDIRAVHAMHADKIGGTITHTGLDISPMKYARGFSTDAPERFQGFHDPNILFVVDEASGVEEDVFEAIEGSMTTPGARLLLIGNPTQRQGTFFDAFHSRRSLWHTIHISAFDTPNVRRSTGGPSAMLRRVVSGLTGGLQGGEGSEEQDEGSPTPGPSTAVGTTNENENGDHRAPGPSAAVGTTGTASTGQVATPQQGAGQNVPGLVSAQWVADAEKMWGKKHHLYQVKVLGEFPTQSADMLIGLDLIEEAQTDPGEDEEEEEG